MRQGTTNNNSCAPYLLELLGALTWLYYAIIHRELDLIILNSVVSLVNAVYIAAFIYYSPGPIKVIILLFLKYYFKESVTEQ